MLVSLADNYLQGVRLGDLCGCRIDLKLQPNLLLRTAKKKSMQEIHLVSSERKKIGRSVVSRFSLTTSHFSCYIN